MSLRRRLASLERAFPPRQAVILWFEAVNRYPSLAAYVRACLEQDEPRADLGRLHRQVVASVTDSLKGRPSREIARAPQLIQAAIRDAAFLYQLLLTLNESLGAIAEIASLRAHVLVGEMGRLLNDPLSEDDDARFADPEGVILLDAAWRLWREAVETLVDEIEAERLARTAIDARYFAARSVLFREVAQDWTRCLEWAARLEPLLEMLREPFRTRAGMPPATAMSDRGAAMATRAGRRAADLIDSARVAVFAFLGDDYRAHAILKRQLRDSSPASMG